MERQLPVVQGACIFGAAQAQRSRWQLCSMQQTSMRETLPVLDLAGSNCGVHWGCACRCAGVAGWCATAARSARPHRGPSTRQSAGSLECVIDLCGPPEVFAFNAYHSPAEVTFGQHVVG